MKDFVMWAMLACLLVGIPMFYIGRLIEKGHHLMETLKGVESQSKLGERLCWAGMGISALGFILLLFVWPKL
jgi:hypothetical protein